MDFSDHEDLNSHRKMPLFLKGEEILQIVKHMLDLVPEDAEELEETVRWMQECAYTMTVKISGAEGGDLYDIRMECAALIRKAARELITNLHALQMFGYKHTDYFPLLRTAVEEFRVLFVAWVAGFDKSNYIYDNWGVFNPSGVIDENGLPF